MEKAEILEMTVAYVRQLHGARCRSPSNDVIAGALRLKSHTKVRNGLQEFDFSSSEEYRAGFNECLFHVQRFLADHAAAASAEKYPEVALPQLLIGHLSQFVVDSRRPKDDDRLGRSSPPSPDTTLSALPSNDQPIPQLPSTSPAIKRRQSYPRNSTLTADQTSSSLGRCVLPSLLFPPSAALRRDHQLSSREHETQRRLRNNVFVSPPAHVHVQPSSSTSFSLSSPSTSMSVSSDCSSPQRDNAAATCLQPASPGNADHDVWRPWRPETTTCFQCSDVSDTSSALWCYTGSLYKTKLTV